MNYIRGPMENRLLLTGLHTIADIHCVACNANLGFGFTYAFFSFRVSHPNSNFYVPLPSYAHTNHLLKTSQEEAFEEDQKYKIGKVILEKATICRVRA